MYGGRIPTLRAAEDATGDLLDHNGEVAIRLFPNAPSIDEQAVSELTDKIMKALNSHEDVVAAIEFLMSGTCQGTGSAAVAARLKAWQMLEAAREKARRGY